MAPGFVDSTSAAIAKLRPIGGKATAFLGSSFAISRTHALTAFHCIGDMTSQLVIAPRVLLEFLNGETIEAEFVTGSSDEDFALLRLARELPQALQPLALVRGVTPFKKYRCFGFPAQIVLFALTTVSGTITNPTGTLQNGARALQLHCQELDGALDLRGLSGGPILIQHGKTEAAVGIVRQLQQRSLDDPVAVGNFFAACPIHAVITHCPQLAALALDAVSERAIKTLVSRAADEPTPLAPTDENPWTKAIQKDTHRPFPDFAGLAINTDPLRRDDIVHVKFARELQGAWKDPLISELAALERKGQFKRVERIFIVLSGVEYDLKGYIQCIPGFSVDIEWRSATHVLGPLWGPLKLRSTRSFVDVCGQTVVPARIVRIAAPTRLKNPSPEAIRIRVQCTAYDEWLQRDWAYYKGLESALTRNALYQSESALELRQAGHLTAVAERLLLSGHIPAMIPRRYRYLIAERPIEVRDIALVLEGLIDQFHGQLPFDLKATR